MFNIMYRSPPFRVQRYEMIVRLVDVGGFVDHHYLNFLSIKLWTCTEHKRLID